MSAISQKSISGITSITTPAGVDNVFTVHTNDTTERFRVDSNGNQSISGILTVAQDLDVDGHTNLDNVNIAGVVTATTFVGNLTGNATGLSGTPNISCGTIAGSTGTFSGNLNVAQNIVHTGDTDTKIEFLTDNICFDTGGSERLRINSSGLVNIGAGSSSSGLTPILHLHKNASSTAYLHITNNNTGITNNDGFLLGINGVGDCLVFNKDSTPIRFATQGIERLRITSTGELVFAADTDTFIDHPNANQIEITAGNIEVATFIDGQSNRPAMLIDKGGVNNTTGGANYNSNGNSNDLVVGNVSSGNHGITICSPSDAEGNLNYSDGSGGGADAYRGTVGFNHTDEKMIVRAKTGKVVLRNDATDTLVASGGKVGIGSDNPDALLSLSGTDSRLRLTKSNAAANLKHWDLAAQGQILRLQAKNDASSGGGNIFDFWRSTNQINEFRGLNAGNTWFVIDNSSKKVGIGTDDPQDELHIEDATPAIRLTDSANNQYAFIDGNSGNLVLHSDKGNSGGSSTVKFGVDNSVKMTLDSNGHLDLATGNLQFANGSGIDFSNVPATSGNTVSSDGNKFDDYEEGYYDPTLTPGNGNVTSTTSVTLRYVKVGRLVHIVGRLHFYTNQNDLSSFTISLPFANATTNKHDTSVCTHVIRGNGGDPVQGIRIFRIGPGGTVMYMNDHEGAGYGNLGTTSPHININFSYFAA